MSLFVCNHDCCYVQFFFCTGSYFERIGKSIGAVVLVVVELLEEIEKEGREQRLEDMMKKEKEDICV